MHTHCSQGCQTQIHRDKLSFQMGLADLGVQTHQGLGGSFGMCFPIPTAQALPAPSTAEMTTAIRKLQKS